MKTYNRYVICKDGVSDGPDVKFWGETKTGLFDWKRYIEYGIYEDRAEAEEICKAFNLPKEWIKLLLWQLEP